MHLLLRPICTRALAGIVERVTFHRVETGFCVLRVKVRGHRDLATIVGHAATTSLVPWLWRPAPNY